MEQLRKLYTLIDAPALDSLICLLNRIFENILQSQSL